MTPEQLVEVKARLKEARSAYHALMTGQTVVRMRDQNGEDLSFNRATKGDLYNYIQELQKLIPAGDPDYVAPVVNQPLGFLFR